MRVSTFMIYDRTKQSFQGNFAKLYEVQRKLASGLKINKPSDDTIGMQKVLDYKLTLNHNEQYRKNMDDARSFLEATDSALEAVTDNLQRMHELMIDASNGSRGPVDRQDVAKEIAVLKDALYNLSNSKFRDRYLFSGFNAYTSSYATNAGGSYTYLGDANQINVDISLTGRVTENITGTDAFAMSLPRSESMRVDTGNFAHISSIASSAQITIVMSTSSDPTVAGYDQLSFTNYIDMAKEIEIALNTDNIERLSALQKCVFFALDKTTTVRSTVGARLNYISSTRQANEDSSMGVEAVKSNVEDADMAEVMSDISKTEVALQALRQTSAQILSQSLLDFLK
ncbi:flagellar hook-associated protein FlgL [Candidatus Magnetobacterium casense]|uniref:flagellar hook-associated protein FlgL n=1 Tax=Candidatus Magnetobacterium casense TaxID=1455061 RepID=UPI0009DFD3DA|nr:flagellar hook-associated protein FlgL [Candidatus Magnetobacterium casensis]